MLLRSIRSQLLGLVLATVVPFITLIGIGFWNQWSRDEAAAVQRATGQARLLAAQVDDHIGNLENLMTGLARALSTDPADAAANDLVLRQVKAELPDFVSNVILFSLDGNSIGTSSEVLPRPYAGDRKFFAQILAGHRLGIGDVMRARQSGQLVVSVARPVLDKSGRLKAVLAVGTLLEHFQDALRIKDFPAGSVVSILDQNGIVIARSIGAAAWIGRDLGKLDIVARHLAAKEISEVAVWPDGVKRITGSSTAHSVPWLVSVGLPADIAFAAVARRLGWGLLFISIALAAAFAIAWMLSGRIVRPLRQLGKDASALAAGDLSHRSAVAHARRGRRARDATSTAWPRSLEQREHEAHARRRMSCGAAKDTLAAVIDASPVAIVCSDLDRRIVLWSRAAEQIFGYSAEETIGQPRPSWFRRGRRRSRARCSTAPSGARPSATCELKRRRKDGTLRRRARRGRADVRCRRHRARRRAGPTRTSPTTSAPRSSCERVAHYDQLTGLPNRLTLQKELRPPARRHGAAGRPPSRCSTSTASRT